MAKTIEEIKEWVRREVELAVRDNWRSPIGQPIDILENLKTYNDDFFHEWEEFWEEQGWGEEVPLDDPTFQEILKEIAMTQDYEVMVPPREIIGQRIKELMKEQHVSAKELSHRTGYTESNLSRIINGKYSVGIDVFMTILDALGKDIEFIDKIQNELDD